MRHNNENDRKEYPWDWFTEKVLPPLFVALTMAVLGACWATYATVQSLSGKVEQNASDIVNLRARIEIVGANAVTRPEILETVKRVELAIENLMLRSGVKNPQLNLQR